MQEENDITNKLASVCFEIDALTQFIQENEDLIQAHMNDFIVNDLRKLIMSDESECKFKKICEDLGGIDCCLDYRYGYCHHYCIKNQFAEENENHPHSEKIEMINDKQKVNTHLSVKKIHEIVAMSSNISKICQNTKCTDLVDFGSGKGYLGQFLSDNYDFNVLGIEGCFNHSVSAINRQQKFDKFHSKENCNNNFKTINYEINKDSLDHSDNFISTVQENMKEFSDTDVKGAVMIGLHACGDLTSDSLRLFSKEPFFRALQIVGCCYNLCSEYGFPLSEYAKSKNIKLEKNALMLACQSPVKWSVTNQKLLLSLLYRAIFQKILYDKKIDNDHFKHVKFRGVGKKSNSFKDYLSYVCQNVPPHISALMLDDADKYFLDHKDIWDEMKQLHWIRMQLAPCIEKFILLDRLCYLYECGLYNASIIRLFDTSLSPRCLALICDKK